MRFVHALSLANFSHFNCGCRREQVAQASKALREVFEFDLADMKLHAEDRSPPKTPDACDRCGRYKYVMPETEL